MGVNFLVIFLGMILFLLGIICGIAIICALIVSNKIYVNLEYEDEDDFFEGGNDEKFV